MKALASSSKRQEKVKDIRSELKLFFPSASFHISSKLGNDKLTIVISYTDGPSKTRVRNITRQFSYSYLSGDSYINVSLEINRKMSDKTKNLLLNEMKSIWKIKGHLKMLDYCPQVNSTVGYYVNTIFSMRDF